VIKAVIDTNVLVSGLVHTNSATAPTIIIDAWVSGQFTLILSDHIRAELLRTLNKPYFKKRIAKQKIKRFIKLLDSLVKTTVIIEEIHHTATHPEDDIILATAVNAKADYLVTGDKKLLQKVGISFRDIRLVTPAEFLKLLY